MLSLIRTSSTLPAMAASLRFRDILNPQVCVLLSIVLLCLCSRLQGWTGIKLQRYPGPAQSLYTQHNAAPAPEYVVTLAAARAGAETRMTGSYGAGATITDTHPTPQTTLDVSLGGEKHVVFVEMWQKHKI